MLPLPLLARASELDADGHQHPLTWLWPLVMLACNASKTSREASLGLLIRVGTGPCSPHQVHYIYIYIEGTPSTEARA